VLEPFQISPPMVFCIKRRFFLDRGLALNRAGSFLGGDVSPIKEFGGPGASGSLLAPQRYPEGFFFLEFIRSFRAVSNVDTFMNAPLLRLSSSRRKWAAFGLAPALQATTEDG